MGSFWFSLAFPFKVSLKDELRKDILAINRTYLARGPSLLSCSIFSASFSCFSFSNSFFNSSQGWESAGVAGLGAEGRGAVPGLRVSKCEGGISPV